MHAIKPKKSEHQTLQETQRANRRAEMRFELVKAMVTGVAPAIVTDDAQGIDTAACSPLLIRVADAIIDALEARHAAERRGE